MDCWKCERPAHGVCAFCGRGVCKDHTQSIPNILAVFSSKDEVKKAIVVQDALYCGLCRPAEEPVPLENIE
jgi:hypothetical protein